MQIVGIREFKTHATELMRQNETILVFRRGQPAGVFIPWSDIALDDELRTAALQAFAAKIRKEREVLGVTEEEVLDDFADFRKNRR